MQQRNPHFVAANKAKQELDRLAESKRIVVQKSLHKYNMDESGQDIMDSLYKPKKENRHRYESSEQIEDPDRYLENKSNFTYVSKKSN